jgi:peptide/nickel transport system ATP-binding protein
MKSLLEVEDLTIQVGNETLVSQVHFSVFPGECTAIVGESGSGKTLSCMTLLQLNPISFNYPSGCLQFDHSIAPHSSTLNPQHNDLKDLRGKKIGMIFQEPMSALNPTMKVGEQVAEGMIFLLNLSEEEAKKKVVSLFEEVKIPDPSIAFEKYPHEMSGGQRQRVMIAMALSCDPLIIIADEPTTALDVSVQKAVLSLLKEIQEKRRIGLIFISHDLAVVKDIAQHVYVMQKGRVVESGKAANILDNPQHPYTKGLLACRPHGKKRGERLLTLNEVPQENKVHSAQKSNEIILAVKKLYKQYDQFLAVNDISFEILKGETLGLIGESGCGKTTLSRMVMGLLPMSSGEILWKNQLLTHAQLPFPKIHRKNIQMIFQDPFASLNPKLTIQDILTEPMRIHGIGSNAAHRTELAIHWLEKVGMPHPNQCLSKYPHHFSGGQRQRIVIARALACEPELIICDESVAALDVSVQAQVLNLLNDLKAELSLTFLFISHDLHVVKYMSDRVMVMQKGRIVEIGDTDEVFDHPKNDYTKSLLASVI